MLELSYKKILFIALPLMFGTFVQSMIGIIDGAFVSNLGNNAYNAVGNGSIMYVALFMLCRGLADGTQITIAQKYGEEKHKDIGAILFNSQFQQLIISGFIFTLFFFFSGIIIESIVKSTTLAESMTDFMRFRSWGIFFASIQVTLAAFFIGIGKTRIIIFSTLLLALCNIFLDYSLIYGEFGLPELGMIGAPIASSIAEMVTCFFLLFVILKGEKFKIFAYSLKLKVKKSIQKSLFLLSYPLMLQGLVSLSTWLIFFTMLEHLGPNDLEVAHNIRYMYFLAFIPIFGFASATRTFIGNLVGRNEKHLIPKIQFKIMTLAFIGILIIFHGALFYPELLISIVEHNPDVDPAVLENSAKALRFVSGSIFLYAVAAVPYNAISALGKTRLAFLIEFCSIILYLVGCYLFIELWKWDIVDVWAVEYLYFGTIGLLSALYLLLNRYKLGLVLRK